MASAARLERLRKVVQSDLEALPDRPSSPKPDPESDLEGVGGVSLEANPSQHERPTPSKQVSPPDPTPPSKPEASSSSAPPIGENTDRRFVWVQGATSSYNLGSAPKLSTLPTTKLPQSDLKKGDLAPAHQYFTPIQALAKYPYKFCNQKWMQDIASGFFDGGKFWTREWDLYYVWDIDSSKPLILVSESQFEDLLKEINTALKLGVKITNQQREEGLVSRFPDHPRCLPRYLGRSHSREEHDNMVEYAPSASFRAAGEPESALLEGRTLEDFKQMMEELWDIQRAKGKAAKEKKKLERLARQKVFADQFKRAQRYLGLRPTASEGQTQSGLPPAIDTSVPAPFPTDRSVVFVCVDVESYERAHHKITEIGVATLDTRDLAGVAPGKDGENWRTKIRARHFRVHDHAHLVNSEFVSGCPDRFDFGESEWLYLNEAPAKVAACFKPPFCAQSQEGSGGGFVNMMHNLDINEQRNLIFLGHDTIGDVRYLQLLGFDPLTLPNLLEAQDTATMYRVWRREQQPTKLGNILYDFDILGFNLHNAGNDAVFTVQAMLGICVREASIRGTPEMKDKRDEEKATKIAAAAEEAKKQAADEVSGWSDHEQQGDGGEPVPIVIKETPKPTTSPPHTGVAGFVPRNQNAVKFGAPSPFSERGRGRGRGAPKAISDAGERGKSNGGYHNRDVSAGSSDRGDYRHPGRPQGTGRGSPRGRSVPNGRRGRARGGYRGRARGSSNTENRPESDGGFPAPEPKVTYYW